MTLEIVYETHSTTLDNERGNATGWLDGNLSEVGKEQARELGERHADKPVDIVFTSDLGRAVETAKIAFGDRDVEIRRDARLRECNFGTMNGAPVVQVHEDLTKHIDEPYPQGESYRDVVERMRTFLDDVIQACDGKRVVLISHRAPYYAMEHLLNIVPLEDVVAAPFDWQPGWRYVVA